MDQLHRTKAAGELRIYGASDDLIEIDGPGVRDELAAWERPREVRINGSHGLVVSNQHGKKGWVTTIHFGDDHEDGDPILPMRVELSERGYSLAVVIDCPAGSTVEWDEDHDDE